MKTGSPKIIKQDKTYLAFPIEKDQEQEARKLVVKYAGKVLSVEAKQFRKPRSDTQNAYLWTLCQALGQALGISKDDVYRQVIRDYGQFETATVKTEAAKALVDGWERNHERDGHLGWFAESADNYDGTTTVILYFGSSSYDTLSQKRLIDALVQECEDLCLDVQIPDEIKALMKGTA